MKTVFLLFVSFASVCKGAVNVQYCPFFGNRAPSPQANLENCTWFSGMSCCRNEEISSIFPTVLPPDKASKSCLDYIRFQMCSVCDPQQANYYANDRLTLCEEYCNDMYSACSGAQLEGQTIGEAYSSGKEYCEALSFDVVSETTGECFTFDPANAGSRLLPSSVVLLLLASFLGLFDRRYFGILIVVLSLLVVRGRGQALTSADVKTWAQAIGSQLTGLARDGLKVADTQRAFDMNSFLSENISGLERVERIANGLEAFFDQKQKAVQALADEAEKLYQDFERSDYYVSPDDSSQTVTPNTGLRTDYSDADFPKSLLQTSYSDVFKQKVSFNRSVIKLPDAVSRSDARVAAEIRWTNGLDDIFKKNYQNDSSLRWQYFATTRGMIRVYPSYEWGRNIAGFHRDYDPRIRPWYVSSTSGPKNVMIILDCSSSMVGARWQIAKAAAKTILNTLTQQDYVNVICTRDSYYSYYSHYRYRTSRTLGCLKSGLLPATTSVKRDLMEKIDEIEPDGRSLFIDGFRMAMDVFQFSQPPLKGSCQNVAIFLTDGLRQDGNDVRCEPGFYTYSYSNGHTTRTYHPGRKCNEAWDDVWQEVAGRNPIGDKVHFFAYSVVSGDSGKSLPSRLACENYGSYGELYSPFNTYENLTNYYDFLAQSTKATSIVWTAPYVDVFGLGLLVTIAVPVFSSEQRVVGVMAVDATLEGIENLLNARTWGSVYSFLINKDGETVVHPRLKPSAELIDDPVYPKIEELEQNDGKPTAFSTVLTNMLAGKNGSFAVTGPRFVAKGDFQDGFEYVTTKSTYYYAPVKTTDYYMAINIPEIDTQYHQANEPNNVDMLPTTYYYRIDEYNGILRNDFPTASRILDIRQGEVGYADLTISVEKSVVKLAPKAFCDPLRFLVEEYPGTKDVHEFLNSKLNLTANRGCFNGGTYARATRPDSQLTSQLETIWKNRPDLPAKVAWTYIGMQGGVWRVLPGAIVSRAYDPTARPWYKRAVANPGKLALSSVYLDAGGVGKVVTLSEVIYQAPSSVVNCATNSQCLTGGVCRSGRCTSEHVAGVVALDVRYADFYQYVLLATTGNRKCGARYACNGKECQTKCYIINDVGRIVFDDGILSAADEDERSYLNVPFGYREGKVMTDVTYNGNLFERSAQRDFQGLCSVTPYAPRVTNDDVVFTAAQEREYVRNRGDIRRFRNQFGCVQDAVSFADVSGTLESVDGGVLDGSARGPCGEGNYFVTSVPDTNLYLVVIDSWNDDAKNNAFNFNCHIANRVSTAGAFRVVNQTCSDDVQTHEKSDEQCPPELGYTPLCQQFNDAHVVIYSSCTLLLSLVVSYFIY